MFFWDGDLYQGALEAIALGQVYRMHTMEESVAVKVPVEQDATIELP